MQDIDNVTAGIAAARLAAEEELRAMAAARALLPPRYIRDQFIGTYAHRHYHGKPVNPGCLDWRAVMLDPLDFLIPGMAYLYTLGPDSIGEYIAWIHFDMRVTHNTLKRLLKGNHIRTLYLRKQTKKDMIQIANAIEVANCPIVKYTK